MVGLLQCQLIRLQMSYPMLGGTKVQSQPLLGLSVAFLAPRDCMHQRNTKYSIALTVCFACLLALPEQLN